MMFSEDGSAWGHEPYRVKCKFCDSTMVVHIATIGPPPHNQDAWVNSMTFKCVECCNIANFDVPISEEYAEELERRRGGRQFAPTNTDELERVYSDSEMAEVKRRLVELGYW